MDTDKIIKILKEERTKRNLSQQKISEILNISRNAYTMYETGKSTPTLETIVKLADYYNVPTDYLLGRQEQKQIQREKTEIKRLAT